MCDGTPQPSSPRHEAVMRMRIVGAMVGLLLLALFAGADETDLSYNIPAQVERCMKDGLDAKYRIDTSVNPFYLRGDFDGDGKMDDLVRIASKQSKKGGLIACWGQSGKKP